jgi:tetratricopeptide (TPR) repeat protein
VRRYHNDVAAAERDYQTAIEIARTVWTDEPKNIVYKTHLALALVDSGIFSLERHDYATARPLFVESVRLFRELADADPEDREAQVWLVHAQYQFGRLEQDQEHFAEAEEIYQPALDRLLKLDSAGRLEGRPAFKYRHMRVLKEKIAFCKAAPNVVEDPSVVRSQPLDVTIGLLRLRCKRLAELGRFDDLAATAEMLRSYREGEWEEQYHLACALALCVRYFDDSRASGSSGGGRSQLRTRFADEAVAALARAVDRGFQETHTHLLEVDHDLAPLRDYPGFHALVDRMKSHKTPVETRYPVR